MSAPHGAAPQHALSCLARTCCQVLHCLQACAASEAVSLHYRQMPCSAQQLYCSSRLHAHFAASTMGITGCLCQCQRSRSEARINIHIYCQYACTFGCPVLHRYKDFLDSVTPAEWFVAQAEKQEVSKTPSLVHGRTAWQAQHGFQQTVRQIAFSTVSPHTV